MVVDEETQIWDRKGWGSLRTAHRKKWCALLPLRKRKNGAIAEKRQGRKGFAFPHPRHHYNSNEH